MACFLFRIACELCTIFGLILRLNVCGNIDHRLFHRQFINLEALGTLIELSLLHVAIESC